MIAIIGGGPAGLSTAIYTARAGLAPIVFAGSPPGGQLMLTSEVENFPGYQKILGSELISTLRKQANAFGTELIDDNITSVDFSNELSLTTSKKTFRFRSIIIATGAQALWLGLDSETRLRGKGVSACATCDGFFFRDKKVAVVGGGDTAMEEAQTLTKFAKKVIVLHRRDSFRASKIMQERVLNNPKIEVMWNTSVIEILGDQKVEGIKIEVKNSKSNVQDLDVDGVFIAIGHKPDTKIFQDSIQLDEKGYIMTTATIALNNFQFPIFNLQSSPNKLNVNEPLKIKNSLEIDNLKLKIPKFDVHYPSQTSVRGVFAAGDCVDHTYRQAGTAAGMGIAAALDAERWLERGEK